MLRPACFTLILGVLIPWTNGYIVTDNPPEDSSCVPLRDVLEGSFVEYAALYFADNPRGKEAPIDPATLDPPTAQNLFITYYGDDASSSGFKESITRILYSDPGNSDSKTPQREAAIIESDRVMLRDNIYTYAKAGSYNIAREKFGVLLYKDADEVAGDLWMNYRCIEDDNLSQFEAIVYNELAKIRNEVGEFKFGQFLGLGSGTTLAFAIDDTGSMGGEIGAAKKRAISIIDERQGSLDQPQNFVLVPFNDPGVGPLTVTHDPEDFKKAINRLYAHGGGDAPELSMRGIQLAVENSNAGSTIFVITDIDAKDVELQDNVIAQAKQKNIKVTFLLTNQISTTVCSAWGRNDPKRCDNKALKLGYELYEHIAKSTGGSILVVSKRDIFKATEVIESALKQGLETLFIKTFKRGKKEASFFVDSSLKELYLESEGNCGTIDIHKPNEEKVDLEGEVVVDKLKVRRAAVEDVFGKYKLTVNSRGRCNIKVSAKSTKGFVRTLAKKITDSESGETRIERFEGQALADDKVVVFIDEFGKQAGDVTDKIEIMARNSDTNYEFEVADETSDHFVIELGDYPQRSLMVMVHGVDKNGYRFQRVSQALIEFVTIDIDCSAFSDIVFRAGDNATVDVNVRNLGKSEELSMEASDDKRYVRGDDVQVLKLKKGTSEKFPVFVKADKNQQTGTVSTITITASPKGSDNLIFKQCRLIVGQKETPDIESFHIVSNINSRFVETAVTSTVFNNASIGRTAEFNVIMPLDSFITEFSMTIDNETYPGEIKEKEEAKRIFQAAQARGVTAGHVAAREKSTTVFKTSVNLEANKRVVFSLKYQQLLRRSRGKYHHEIIVQTKQPVGELSVDVYICETRKLASVEVLGFDTEQTVIPGLITMPGVTVDQQSKTAHVSFKPTRAQQLELSPLGLNGKFIVEYDVIRGRGKGVNEVVLDGKHFVHFFSTEMEAMSKRVVFLLDTSASMFGRKLEQVRKAMGVIFDGLSPEDHFAIVTFNSNVTRWDPNSESSMALVTDQNRASAKAFLSKVKTTGGTNIEAAIKEGIKVLKEFTEETEKELHPTSDFILLLTDGRPTEGKVDSKKLVRSIDVANNRTYGIHTIGFGSLVDAETLAKIAARNNGSSIQIFEDINADSQITEYFETFARPMLHDIEIKYEPEEVEETTWPIFPVICFGGELIVAGRLRDDVIKDQDRRRRRATFTAQMIDFTITGKEKGGKDFMLDLEIEPTPPSTECIVESTQVENFTERLNIFMELQHMLKRISAENNETVKETLKEQTLNQSLEYGFVTPGITSMVVLKPEDKEKIEKELAEKAKKEKEEKEKKEKEERERKERERKEREEREKREREKEEEEKEEYEETEDKKVKEEDIMATGTVMATTTPITTTPPTTTTTFALTTTIPRRRSPKPSISKPRIRPAKRKPPAAMAKGPGRERLTVEVLDSTEEFMIDVDDTSGDFASDGFGLSGSLSGAGGMAFGSGFASASGRVMGGEGGAMGFSGGMAGAPGMPSDISRGIIGRPASPSVGRIVGGGETRPLRSRIVGGVSRPMPTRPMPLEFFADPHFVVSLSEQMTICFDWFGKQGQVFNLIHDEESGITVNGKLKILKSAALKQEKTYVDGVGIKLSRQNITIRVSLHDITVTNHLTAEIVIINFIESKKTLAHGIEVVVDSKNKNKAEAFIKVMPGVVFRIFKLTSKHEDIVSSHLDFSIFEREGISEKALGVLGQFSTHNNGKIKEEAMLEFATGRMDQGILWYRQTAIQTELKTMHDYGQHEDIDCWFIPHVEDIMDKQRLLLSGLFDEPM